jgi:hypothetical protein
VERGQHKRWFSVTPSMLRDYIEKNLTKIKTKDLDRAAEKE